MDDQEYEAFNRAAAEMGLHLGPWLRMLARRHSGLSGQAPQPPPMPTR